MEPNEKPEPTAEEIVQASQRWISEGLDYKNRLNDWLDIIYIDSKQPDTPCPEETRKDMFIFVVGQIQQYNNDEKYDELRRLFPPDNDPMNWKNITVCVSQVAMLPDKRLVVTVGEWFGERWLYVINGNERQLLEEDIFMFGKSHDKKYFAKVWPDRIDVSEGWDGEVLHTFYPPKDYGADFKAQHPNVQDGLSKTDFKTMKIQQVVVFPAGNRIAIATFVGIFVSNTDGTWQFIQTEKRKTVEPEEGFTFRYDYPHIDISPDEKYLAAGSQSSPHLVFEEQNGQWEVVATVEPRSEYPNLAKFNYKIADASTEHDGPQLLLCSCHMARSASVSLPVKNITPGLNASGYDADKMLNYPNEQKWIFSVGSYSWGWALGANDGYVWFKHFSGYQLGYLHVGGTVMDIDFSDDRRTMVVASYNGQVIVYDCSDLYDNGKNLFRNKNLRHERRKDDFAVTNTACRDEKRYLFFRNMHPLIW